MQHPYRKFEMYKKIPYSLVTRSVASNPTLA